MVISETVQMRWGGRNIEYFVSKGYTFTKAKDVFDVKVEDLPAITRAKVVVRCDMCGKERITPYIHALPRISSGNLCKKCTAQKTSPIRAEKFILKTESFLQYNLRNIGEDFVEKYWSLKNDKSPSEYSYSSNRKVWIKCQKATYHEDYLVNCSDFIRGDRCPYCKGLQIHPNDSIGSLIDKQYYSGSATKRWSSNNDIDPYVCAPHSPRKIWLTCPDGVHTDYCQSAQRATVAHFRCPMCTRHRSKSLFQEKVENYIHTEYGYEMRFERSCSLVAKNPQNGRTLPYDIEVILQTKNILIEVNGQQHYIPTKYNFNHPQAHRRNPSDELEYQQWKDQIKKDYAISQGYTFLEIPYTTERNESYKSLIDSAIFQALSKQNEAAV